MQYEDFFLDDSVLSIYKEGKWCYENGCWYRGLWQLYTATGDKKYFEKLVQVINRSVDEQGQISLFNIKDHNVDQDQPAAVLADLYTETKDERYRIALEMVRNQLRSHPRTKTGNFWHKQCYTNQVWLDGIYMAFPVLASYHVFTGEAGIVEDLLAQIQTVRRVLRDEQSGLYWHAWEETREQGWSDPDTGRSPHFWSRGIGWFIMALVDLVDILGDTVRSQLAPLVAELASDLLRFQDASGMWYQIPNLPDRAGNYLETSGTLMFAYAFLKGRRLGILGSEFKDAALRAISGTEQKYLRVEDSKTFLGGICRGAGLGSWQGVGRYRDGSFEYYMSEPVVENDPKGVAAFMMCYAELERDAKNAK